MCGNRARSSGHEARLLIAIPDFVTCTVENRLNRFVVAVRHRNGSKLAHINNTGRLLELLVKGREAACLPWSGAADPRKTSYRLFAVREEGGWALIDTRFQTTAFEKAVAAGRIGWLNGYSIVGRNPRLGEAVLDYLLTKEPDSSEMFLETKSAVMREGALAMYPDCPTTRGQKHVLALMQHVKQGGRGTLCFIAALPGVTAFKPSSRGDPVIAGLIRECYSQGVDVRAVAMQFDGNGILLDNADLPVLLS